MTGQVLHQLLKRHRAQACPGTEHPEHKQARQDYVVYRHTHGRAIGTFHGLLMNTLDTFKVITWCCISYYFDYVLNSDIPLKA
jgi:hypothetical protein